MKTMFLSLTILLGSIAHAAPTVSSNLFNVAISEARVNAVIPPPMLTVQPQAYLVFKYSSCGVMPLELVVTKASGALNVAVALPMNTVDCMGSARERQYELQITSDYNREPIYIVNHLEGSQAASLYELPTTTLGSVHAIPLKAARLSIGQPPPLAAVQPTAFIDLKISSCSARDLEANVIEKDGRLDVLVVDKKQIDCRAKAIERDYSVQISSDYRNQPVRILNPVELDFK